MTTAFAALVASHAHDWEHGWWPIWPLFWFALTIGAFWFFGRRRWSPGRPQDGAGRAKDILAERVARGEISGEEYRERLEQLR
jgi:putative membrane protein